MCGHAGNQLQAVGRIDLEQLSACRVLDLGENHGMVSMMCQADVPELQKIAVKVPADEVG